MISVENLGKTYGDQVLFEGAGFNINSGERIGLVGRNGHGKTTLFRLISGDELPDSGTVSVPNGYRIGRLEQIMRLGAPTVLDEACLGLPEERRHERWRVQKILAGLGFPPQDMERPPEEFSGGFQVRLKLASVLASEPDLLLLDEPTNYLDIASLDWLAGFLTAWKRELMLITHDRSFMDRIVTHTLGIYRAGLRKVRGGTDAFYEQIALEEDIAERTRARDERRRQEVEVFINRFRAKARLSGLVQSRIKSLARMEKPQPLEQTETADFAFHAAPFKARRLMAAEELNFAWGDGVPPLIEGLDLEIAAGDRIAVVGRNGRGKTTLLRLLNGELSPAGGGIRSHAALRTGCFGQTNIDRLNGGDTVVEAIISASPECTPQAARNIAGSLAFEGDAALKRISVLSGGERSRVLLGRLIVSPANLLLLDEPTNHLDMETSDSLLAALDAFPGAIVIVTHNETYLHTLADRLIVFDQGLPYVYEGSYGRFLEEVGWREAAGEAEYPGDETEVPGTDRKALRKQKALLIQRRSALLRPLETEIARLEAEITDLENEATQTEMLLIEASHAGDAPAIISLDRRGREIEELISDLNDRLYELYEKHERESAVFRRELLEVGD